MSQQFDANAKLMITRDTDGVVREMLHTEEPFASQAGSALLAARDYLATFGTLLGIAPAELVNFSSSAEPAPVAGLGVEYRFVQEKPQFDMTTVVFEQTLFGLPVWLSAVAVQMRQRPFVVVGAQSSRHASVDAEMPSERALQRILKLDAKALAKLLGVADDKDCDAASLTLIRQRLVVVRYEAAQRTAAEHAPPEAQQVIPVQHGLHASLPLPRVGEQVVEGRHYVAAEITFSLSWRGVPDLPWVALVDVESLSVLYLRAFIDDVNGLVFKEDPVTLNGGPFPNATAAELNALRSSVALPDLSPPVAGTYALTGDRVQLVDAELPAIAPPTRPTGSNFDFASRTDNFAAVNAYYHCDRFFQLVEELGFDIDTYFTGTLFPTTVDHRGRISSVNGVEINAHCVGNGTFGIQRTTFMLADLGDVVNPMGLACDWRVVLHELGGHGILYGHVNSPNFGFAHSAGDSFAAVLNDPDTRAADRFQTFPWITGVIARRHDRDVTAGWAWDGVMDFGGYSSEQILCTTHFRLYRSLGGDSAELAMRSYAARYVAYLMLRTIGSFTQPSNPGHARLYAGAMELAEQGNWTSEGEVGAVYHKVVRWSFEKQGLHPPGAPLPIVTEGPPPPIDLYIDDGRHGEYAYQPHFWETGDLWNRLEPDGQPGHQTPQVCCRNHAYVRVKNRGTQAAKGARVRAYHCRPAAGLVWPDDFEPMDTPSLAVPPLPPGGEVVIGPFGWTPMEPGHEVMLMSVSVLGDRANTDPVTGFPSAIGPTPAWRLVPNDNNTAMRAVIPVPGGGGRCALEAAFCNRKFWAQNPTAKTARMEVRAVLPAFLASRGWVMRFDNPGGGRFSLGPRDQRLMRPRLLSGRDFEVDELVDAGPLAIRVLVLADGLVVGGLTFAIDPQLECPPSERCDKPRPEPKPCRCEPCVDERCKPCAPPPCDAKPEPPEGCHEEPHPPKHC